MAPRRSGNGRCKQHGGRVSPAHAQNDDLYHLSSSTNNKIIEVTVDTLEGDTTASLKQATMELAEKVVTIEERTTFLGDLIKVRRGTREVEKFIKNQENLRHEGVENVSKEDAENMVERERELVTKAMENKLNDNILKGARKGRELHQMKGRLLWRLRRETDRRKFLNNMRERLDDLRQGLRRDHKNQVREISMAGKKEDKLKLPPELQRYKRAKIFQPDAKDRLVPGEAIGPVTVGLEENLLDHDEVAILVRGPKFCVRRILDEERFLMECERSFFKVRIDMEDVDEEPDDPGGGEEHETKEEKVERLRIENAMEIAAIEARQVFNEDEMLIDYTRKRATDCKHNTHVKLPGPKSTKVEEGIEYRRMVWRRIFRDFKDQYADEKGIQESNLTENEERGLKKLKKRVKAGEIVIVRTDKSSRFSIMSLKEYERAGNVHTNKDTEVNLEFLIKNQRKINGHLSMLLKTFMVGKSHNHYERIRNLKLTHSLSVAPLYLLFKDHKGWTLDTGKPPPSRPVVSAGAGQNDHLSEIISHILEPVVKMLPNGMEMTSTGDLIHKMEGMSKLVIPVEEINLEEVDTQMDDLEATELELVDRHFEDQERKAKERYDQFDTEMLRESKKMETESEEPHHPKLQGGGSRLDTTPPAVPGQDTVPEGWKEEGMEKTRGMESDLRSITNRWKDGKYSIVLEKMKLMEGWKQEAGFLKDALVDWINENEIDTLIEEGEDIVDGIETMELNEEPGISEGVLMDATEIITSIIVARGMETDRIAPIFLQDGKKTRVKRVGRAENMIKMREEMRILKNKRLKSKTRTLKITEFEDMEVRECRRADTSRRLDKGVLRSDEVDNKMVQDKGNRVQVIGADVEQLYPSLHAVEVAEIVYKAMMDTEVKFDNVEWLEAFKYIALTSTAQECRLGP